MPDEHESADNKPNSAARVPGPPAAVSMSGPSTEFALGEVLAIGGPTTSAWREDALARIAELEMLTMMARARSKVEPRIADEMAASIRRHLDTAKTTAEQRPRRMAGVAGADVTRVLTNIHAAEADLLRLAPIDYLLGQISTLQAYVREHLPASDPRRAGLEALVRSAGTGKLGEAQRGAIVAAAREANAEARREVTRVRSFRNVLLACAAILTVAAIGVAILGIVQPDAMPLCFHPGNKVVCPTEEVLAPPNVSDIDGHRTGGKPLGPPHRRARRADRGGRRRRGLAAEHQGHDDTLRPAGCTRAAEAPDRCAHRGPRPPANARAVRARSERPRLIGADHCVGGAVRLRAAALHWTRRRADTDRS